MHEGGNFSSREGGANTTFLATGESFHSLAFQFRILRHAISYIVDETCAAITEVIAKEFMQVPQSEEQWLRVCKKIYERWNLGRILVP